MSRWFRHYAGLCRDDKLVRVALRSKQTVERVVWVWVAVLESAAERDSDGTFEVDHEEVAYFLRCDPEEITRIFDALRTLGRIEDDRVSKWDLRQFKADSSTERVKRYREKRAEAGLVSQWQPSAALRQRVYEKDGFACVYCGSREDLTIDHKTPERRGGDNSEGNLHTACRRCNAQKRDLTHEEFVSRNAVTVSETRQRTETDIQLADANCRPEPAPKPAVSLVDQLWTDGILTLETMHVVPPKARSMVGKWLKDTGSDAGRVLWAINEAQIHGSGDPIPYITRVLSDRPTGQRAPPRHAKGTSLLDGLAEIERRFSPNVQHFPRLTG